MTRRAAPAGKVSLPVKDGKEAKEKEGKEAKVEAGKGKEAKEEDAGRAGGHVYVFSAFLTPPPARGADDVVVVVVDDDDGLGWTRTTDYIQRRGVRRVQLHPVRPPARHAVCALALASPSTSRLPAVMNTPTPVMNTTPTRSRRPPTTPPTRSRRASSEHNHPRAHEGVRLGPDVRLHRPRLRVRAPPFLAPRGGLAGL